MIPTRWVRTNKNDGIYGAPFLAKSRLVVQGFKDKALGFAEEMLRRQVPPLRASPWRFAPASVSFCLPRTSRMLYIGQALRGADFRQRYWSDVNLETAVVIHLADSGHANGTPDHNEVLRYRSVGGYFILVANAEILEGKEARANIIGYHSSQTKRVCRSTLAAEASHLAEAVEAGDWAIVLLEEALTGQVDLKNWDKLIEKRSRAYATDARSVFDYLAKDTTSTSSDKRMAIEGALLRETVRTDNNAHVRWIDGQQNIANVLTKANAEKDTRKGFMRTGYMMSLVQTEANQRLKERKPEERQRRKAKPEVLESKEGEKHARRDAAVLEAKKLEPDDNER